MKSNVITAPIEYIHTSSHKWNIYSRESSSNAIEEYYLREEMARSQILDKAFSRHHAIVSSALDTAVKIVNRAFPKGLVVDTGRRGWVGVGLGVGVGVGASDAYQKHHLVALSGMSGLLVTRLIVSGMTRCGSTRRHARDSHHHLMKTMKKYTQITTYYIHSALTSEILIGNRYYRDILKNTASKRIIGHHGKQYTSEDVTPALVNATKCELRRLYASQITRLTDTVKQYKRGFVNLHEIQNDPEFQRLFAAFWQYSNQVMKKRDNYESSTLQLDDDENDNRLTYYNKYETFKQIKRFFVLSEISEVPAMVPRLYDYDIVHLFDSAAQGFVKYIQIVKSTLIRLANDGLTSAFLSFAAIEPGMVTSDLAPAHGKTYHTLTLKSCANHIPSRDPLYGALRIQHRAHIPRTADVIVDARFDHDHDHDDDHDHEHDQYSDDIVRGLNGMSRFYAIQRIRELSLNTLVATANRVV
jgi:hypothetical protein